MPIPGDIDLTENLDFRNVIRREIPQLPSSWHRNKINDYNENFTSMQNISSNTSSTSYSFYYLNSNNRSNNLQFELSDSFTVSNNYTYSSLTEFNTELNTTYSDDNYYIYNNSGILKLKYNTDEYDIFGNKIHLIAEEKCSDRAIPWNNKYESIINIKRIAWDKILYYTCNQSKYQEYEVDDLPWELEDDYENDYYDDLYDNIERVRQLISWLYNKTRTYIEDYFDSDFENVDLSYLTNMNWIRVNDAIID